MNGKPNRFAVVVKSTIPNSPNLGKIVFLKRIANHKELFKIGIYYYEPVWEVEETCFYYSKMTEKWSPCNYIADAVIKLLPDFDEDEEIFEENSLLLPELQA